MEKQVAVPSFWTAQLLGRFSNVTLFLSFLFQSLLGAFCLFLGSLVIIPCYPVAMTLHSFALFFIALKQPPRLACSSALSYLLLGSFGLPVFSLTANPCWYMGLSSGYFFAFPLVAYCISSLKNSMRPTFAIFFGQIILYLLGCLWLATFIGAWQAFIGGFVVFLPSLVLKNIAASYIPYSKTGS